MFTLRALRGLTATAVTAFLTLTPAAAEAAKPQTTDLVELQNGGMIRGQIMVMTPGEKVVIQVAGEDEPRTIPWSEVSDVQRGEATAKRAPRDDDDDDDDERAEQRRPRVRVHIETDDDEVVLTEHVRTGTVVTPYGAIVGWKSNTVCSNPCGESVSARRGALYTVGGSDIPESDVFALDAYEGDVTLRVDGGSPALLGWGATLTTLGALGLLTGAVFAPIGVAVDSSTGDDFRDAGIGLLVGGAVSLAAGIVMITQGDTEVEIAPRARAAAARERAPRWWLGEF